MLKAKAEARCSARRRPAKSSRTKPLLMPFAARYRCSFPCARRQNWASSRASFPKFAMRATIEETSASSPAAERTRIFEAVYSALRALSRKRPVLIALEDLHWATLFNDCPDRFSCSADCHAAGSNRRHLPGRGGRPHASAANDAPAARERTFAQSHCVAAL